MSEWFEEEEKSAGTKRLYLTWCIYKHFGIKPLKLIAFFIILFAYAGLKEQKTTLDTYFCALENFTQNKKFKPTFCNKFKIFLNYANSLVDKIQGFSGNYKNIEFENFEVQEEIKKQLENKKGIFFITNHIGNVEIMRILLMTDILEEKPKINIFLQKNHCKIFNTFLNEIAKEVDITTYPVEEIDIETSVEIEEKLNNGEIVFMAGDRISAQNKMSFYEETILDKKVKLPVGVLKFAQIMNTNIYFVTCAFDKKGYKIMSKKFEKENSKQDTIKKLQKEYSQFLQSSILKYPYQFYHFSKFFE